ncbi:MAG TPA: T9SS type A sorting domain-containing protein [Candidatus Marinimicrobia bacterium]|nr:T9SS type A sorting domain-containing protein [Candidatus Neomarinimicrobiota bacterium]
MWRIFIFLLIFGYLNAGEIHWEDISSQYDFPQGVTLWKGSRNASILKVFLLEADLTEPDLAILPYLTDSPAIVSALANRFGAIAAVNGGYFGGAISYSAVVQPGRVLAQNVATVTRNSQTYTVLRGFFGINDAWEPAVDWIYHVGATPESIYRFAEPYDYVYNDPNPQGTPNLSEGTPYTDLLLGIGGGPVLIKDGVKNITYNQEMFWGSGVGLTNQDPRTAIAYTDDGRIFLLVADGRRDSYSVGLSLDEVADLFLEKGAVEAINLDGGGSSQMAVPGAFINSPSENRAVPSILAIVYRDSLQLPPEPSFEKIIDTEDADCSLDGGGWFETANAGYYGESKSMLNNIGEGDRQAVYMLFPPQTAEYELFAWWVAANNRCKDTPIVIQHSNGEDTVRVDQTKNHAQWNSLGKFSLNAGRNAKIIISNAGTEGTYIVADAVRMVSFDFVSIQDKAAAPANDFTVQGNFPNPFNNITVIQFSLSKSAEIEAAVFDIQGRKIKTLAKGQYTAGEYRLSWDGTDFLHRPVSAGVYFYRFESGLRFESGKMGLLK